MERARLKLCYPILDLLGSPEILTIPDASLKMTGFNNNTSILDFSNLPLDISGTVLMQYSEEPKITEVVT
jgi:hypothetical protein